MYQHTMECPESHIAGTTKHALPCFYKNLCIGTQGECPEIYIYNGTTKHDLPCFYKNLWLCIGKGECPEIYIHNGTTKHAFELNFVAILLQVIFVEIFLQ